MTHDARVRKEARTLATHGYQVLVVSLTRRGYLLPRQEVVDGYTIHRVVSPRWYRPLLIKRLRLLRALAIFLVVWRGIFYLRKIEARAYHAHDFPALLQLALAGQLNRNKIIYDSHELFFEREPEPFYKYVMLPMRPLEKILIRKTSAVITVAESIADIMAEQLNIVKPTILMNAVDMRTLTSATAEFPHGYRIVAHTGNIVPSRHLAELVEALTYLDEDIVLVLMGEARAYAEELVSLAHEKGVHSRLYFVPPTPPESVVISLSQADVAAVLPASTNLNGRLALPNKLFEAIAAAVPLIAGSNDEIARFVRQYGIGAICDATNPYSIAESIQQILNPADNQRFRTNMKQAQQDINWEIEEKKLLNIYKNTINI